MFNNYLYKNCDLNRMIFSTKNHLILIAIKISD